MRGPVVYCLESVDLPAGVDIGEIRIPSDARLAPRHDATLLGGVTVLEGRACRVRKGDWSGVLYRDLDTTLEDVAITLIPYYAWNNRGLTQMTVWMPLC